MSSFLKNSNVRHLDMFFFNRHQMWNCWGEKEMCKDLVLKQFPGISNVKLHIVATRFGSRKIPPRKHSVTPPVPGVSDLSQLFTHFYSFSSISFILICFPLLLFIFIHFSSIFILVHSFLENTLSLPQSQVSQIAADFLPPPPEKRPTPWSWI